MSDAAAQPSMDDILASIRRIIADEDSAPKPQAAAADPFDHDDGEDTLELVDPVPAPAARSVFPQAARPPVEPAAALLSDSATDATRMALSQLSTLNLGNRDNTLEGLVREMLRPMLKAWLDDRLPGIVEAAVAREVARIAGEGV